MKVIYDSQVFSFQEYGGISRYFIQLVEQFKKKNDIDPQLFVKYSNNHYLPGIEKLIYHNFFPSYKVKGKNSLINKINQIYLKAFIKKIKNPYIFHPTYYNPYFLPVISDNPFVLTVYDMTHEIYPTTFSRFDRTSKNKEIVLKKADKIIAISENTKKDIIRFFKIDSSKIDVIHLANSIKPSEEPNYKFNLPEKYFLFVGQRYSYKNFSLFIKAAAAFLKKEKNLYIICAGGGKMNKNELKKLDEIGILHKVIQMNVDDKTLAQLYSKAIAFIFPSLYEGFGIPVLEAFACGCPAILSNSSSLPEVGGDAALYFNPQSFEDLEENIGILLTNEDLRNELIIKGKRREKLFSWEKTANETLNVYKKIIK